MTPEERHSKIEAEIDKHNEAIRGLIVVGRTCLDPIQQLGAEVREMGAELRAIHQAGAERHDREMAEIRELHKDTEERLNILIDTVDRIIRSKEQGNGKQ